MQAMDKSEQQAIRTSNFHSLTKDEAAKQQTSTSIDTATQRSRCHRSSAPRFQVRPWRPPFTASRIRNQKSDTLRNAHSLSPLIKKEYTVMTFFEDMMNHSDHVSVPLGCSPILKNSCSGFHCGTIAQSWTWRSESRDGGGLASQSPLRRRW